MRSLTTATLMAIIVALSTQVGYSQMCYSGVAQGYMPAVQSYQYVMPQMGYVMPQAYYVIPVEITFKQDTGAKKSGPDDPDPRQNPVPSDSGLKGLEERLNLRFKGLDDSIKKVSKDVTELSESVKKFESKLEEFEKRLKALETKPDGDGAKPDGDGAKKPPQQLPLTPGQSTPATRRSAG